MKDFPQPTLRGIHPRRFGLVSWSPHVAFAFDLVASLRPRLFVELGTHSGESYFAFCQAAQENATGTACYAVDTWKGDPQAGFYPEEVFADVYRHNHEFYPDSYLVRATFDEAVDKFVDGSVDLIHFDGLHTYEAVRHDLERWRPKLSPRGVALFHDIAARHEDFGAWRLWEEISREGRSFAFRHGWGLGVWQPPGSQPSGSWLLETLFSASENEAEAENIRRYYLLATDALRLQKAAKEQVRLDEALNAANAQTAQRDAAIHQLQAEKDETAHRLQAEKDAAMHRLQAEKDAALSELAARLAPVEPEPPQLQVYFSRDGIFHEADSQTFALTPNRWERLAIPLPPDWKGGVLRLDPGHGFGLADVSGIRLRTATLGAEVWQLAGRELAAAAQVGGSAQAMSAARLLRVLCAAPDPQIILPAIDASDYDEPLVLEVGIRVRDELPALMQTFQEAARDLAAWPALQARHREMAEALADLQREQAASADDWQRQSEDWQRQLREAREALIHRQEESLDAAEEFAALRAEQYERQAEEAAAGREIAGLLEELHAVNVRLAASDKSLHETHVRLADKDAELISAYARFEVEHGRARSMRRSWSWKITLPLRAIARFLTGKRTAKQRASLSPPAPAPTVALPVEETPASASIPENVGYRLQIDQPTDWNLPTQEAIVRGWCLPPEGSEDAPPSLRFRCGERQTDVPCDVSRADVQSSHGGNARWRHCGFDAKLTLPPGPSEVIVEAVDARGRVWPAGRFSARTPYALQRRSHPREGNPAHDYAAWVKQYDTFSAEDRARLRAQARALPHRPLISVVMPTYNTPEQWLVKAIESVRRQFYPDWELCIADDCSPQPHVRETLRRYEALDPRIKVVYRAENGHISAASNSALEIAAGEFVALLDHDDELSRHALYMVAETLNAQPGLQMIYSDEDKIDLDGQRRDPYFKPDWNYDLFLGQNMFSHLGVYRRELLIQSGGFQVGLEGSQDYDLALRCLERVSPQQVGHIPHVLYHWRMIPGSTAITGDEKPYAREAARRAITQHLDRLGEGAAVEQNPWLTDFHRVRRPLPASAPEVAIIIPTRDGAEVLRNCVESVLRHTDYPNYRIVIVDNGSRKPETFAYFKQLRQRLPERFQVLDYPGEFNFSAINNFAVREAGAPVLCLLNNDIEAIEAGWLTELVSQALRPQVGAAGARLLYPDNTLQHAGVIIGLGADRTAGHAHHRLPEAAFGYFGRAKLIQQFSAVTAACMVLRREVFEEAGGFNETDFPVGLNDADFCLRLRERGYLILWTPFAALRHHESYSRGVPAEGTPAAERAHREVERFRQRHGWFIQHDPAYNPNLTLDHSDFSLSIPPRAPRP